MRESLDYHATIDMSASASCTHGGAADSASENGDTLRSGGSGITKRQPSPSSKSFASLPPIFKVSVRRRSAGFERDDGLDAAPAVEAIGREEARVVGVVT